MEQLAGNIYGGIQLCKFDEGFTIKYVNEGFTQMTGYTKDDIGVLLGGKHINLVYKADLPVFDEFRKKQLEEKQPFSLEYRVVCKDGRIIWVMDKGMPLLSDNGETDLQCVLTDITAHKEQAEALRLSEMRYEIAMQASGITMFEYDVQKGDLILFPDTANSYELPTVIKDGVKTFVEKGIIESISAADYKEMYRQIHAGAPTAKCYVKAKDASGTIHDYELSLTNIFDKNGTPTRAIGVRKNVSKMMRLQKEQKFGKNFVSGKRLLFEANMTMDKVEYIHERWMDEIGNDKDLPFSQILSQFIQEHIYPEHQKMVFQKMSLSYILEVLEDNSSLITFSYKRKNIDNVYQWYEATVSVIKDYMTEDIRIRFYHKNINKLKEKEQKAIEEQRLYESMIAKATLAYEVNITRNQAIKGHEKWNDLFGIHQSDDYSLMISEFVKKGIHSEDGTAFCSVFRREKVIELFERGERQISCSYRKKEKGGDYHWANCTLHLYEDPETGDIKGFSYVEDIDAQKRKELELQYSAEHDIMTTTYNRSTAEKKIKEYLGTAEGASGVHALFIIDIDHFKNINDTFGHPFGDDVLKETAFKISSVFREQDIVGRMGGDEFCVFMKNSNTQEEAEKKADDICRKIIRIYEKNGRTCSISVSIGIAFYKENGLTYEELYKHADYSLYSAKEHGRNRYET